MLTLSEWRKAGRPHVPVLIKEYMPSEFPPAGAALVWLLNGAGRLRTECRDLPEPHVARMCYQTALTMDSMEPLRWRESECPTCPHLLEAAGLAENEIAVANATINSWTMEKLSTARPRRWLKDYLPLLSLCTPGFYWVRISPHFPTDGGGRLFWSDVPQNLAREIRDFYETPEPLRFFWGAERQDPAFLLPTQQTSAFNEESWCRAQDAHQTHPGVALFLSGYGSALLDGHHRATAAAVAGRRFYCMTFERSWDDDGKFIPPLAPAYVATPGPFRVPLSVMTGSSCMSTVQSNGTIGEKTLPQSEIPPREDAQKGVNGMPNSFDWFNGVLLRHFFEGVVTEKAWLALLNGKFVSSAKSRNRVQKVSRFYRESNRVKRWTRYSTWSLTLIQALVGLRVLDDPTWRRRWDEALNIPLEQVPPELLGLSTYSTPTTIAMEFITELFARNESKHPDLVAELRQRYSLA